MPPAPEANRFIVNLALLRDDHAQPEARELEWLRLFQQFHPRLQGYFRSRTMSPDTLDDLLCEVWRRAMLGVASLRSGAAMWSWLVTIGNNLLRDEWRRQRRATSREVAWTDAQSDDRLRPLIDGWVSAESASSPTTEHEDFVLRSLSEEDRSLLTMFADGFPHDEIARALNLPGAAASRQRLRRLRLRFAPLLVDADIDEEHTGS